MSDHASPKLPVQKESGSAMPKKYVEKDIEPRRKTTTKFSTMVPQTEKSEVELTLEESQMLELTNDEDFVSATSHLSVASTESGNSIFVNADGCQALEVMLEIEDENMESVTPNNTMKK